MSTNNMSKIRVRNFGILICSFLMSLNAFSGSVIKTGELPKEVTKFVTELQDRYEMVYGKENFKKAQFTPHITLVFLDPKDDLSGVKEALPGHEPQALAPFEAAIRLKSIVSPAAEAMGRVNISTELAEGKIGYFHGTGPAHFRTRMGLPTTGDYTVVLFKLNQVKPLSTFVANIRSELEKQHLTLSARPQDFVVHLTLGYLVGHHETVASQDLETGLPEQTRAFAQHEFASRTTIDQITVDVPAISGATIHYLLK